MQGLSFTHEERQLLGIHGLLPATVKTEEEQVQHCVTLLDRYENDLDKYIYLNGLFVSTLTFMIDERTQADWLFICLNFQ